MSTTATDATATPGDLRETVAGFLHAVRNPLAVIRSSAQVAQRLSADSGTLAGYLGSVVVQVDRVENALQGLERLARLEMVVSEEVWVAEAVSQAADRFGERASSRGVALGASSGPERWLLVDPVQLQVALDELLDNAIRHAPPGSRVGLSWSAPDEGRVALHVDDQGSGIAPEHAASIRRPFYSTDRTRLGLGLAVVDRICRLAGGFLTVENRPTGGCRSTMTLPAAGRQGET